jgi:predicted amidophosphoribosyltransferase
MRDQLLSILVPPACAVCRRPLRAAGAVACAGCLRRLPWLRGHRCPRCALPRHRAGCPAAGAAFDRAWAPLAYEGAARDLVAALKFRAALPVAGLMAAHLAANLPLDLRAGAPLGHGHRPDGRAAALSDGHRPDGRAAALTDRHRPDGGAAPLADEPGPAGHGASLAVVPVPAHRGRRRRRGFDPAALLSAALAGRTGLLLAPCLRRRDRGRRQVGAGRALRRSAGRFEAVLVAAPPRAALLVDDVHTTGATLDACARALKAGGADSVAAVTYARTL